MQNYQNYRIVFIDDASTDDTGQEIKYYMKMQSKIPV
jgi:glycosyltransferase involved in cell wall biosynthesis